MKRTQKKLFTENCKECKGCGRILPEDFEGEMCPICQERELFAQVKEYIRSNDVNEHDVAEHFQIPLKKVRTWIRDGRIEYKEEENVIVGLHCQKCGKIIFGGYYCPECARIMNGNVGYSAEKPNMDDSRMRFVDKGNKI